MEYSELAALFPNIYRETELKIKSGCDPAQYPGLFKKFDLLNEEQSGIVPAPSRALSKHKIPKILHFIWLGEKTLPEEFRENISYFSSRMQEAGGVSVLWTDQTEIKAPFRNWLKEEGIRLIAVDSAFGSRESMAAFCHFKAALAKIPSNFGEASDLLRYEIIDRFGGYYLDCDIGKKEIELRSLLSKGKKAGFVCGQCSVKKYCRNDLFGAVPGSPVMKSLINLAISNYRKKIWNSRKTYSRSFLLDFTILTTGPDAFVEAVEPFLSHEKKSLGIVSTLRDYSAESWVYDHTNPSPIRFSNDRDRSDRIEHDLMLNLIYKETILDLEKYQPHLKPGGREWLISLVERVAKERPGLVESVDRIFIGDVHQYRRLQKILEKRKKILWDEAAVLKFACVMKKGDLIRFLIDDRKVNPSEATFADVGFYESF